VLAPQNQTWKEWGLSQYLLRNCFKGVARIRIHEFSIISETNGFWVCVVGGYQVAFFARDSIDQWVDGFLHPSMHVVKGPVFHYQNHNGFDGLLGWWDC
jgi:hypothetical protein